MATIIGPLIGWQNRSQKRQVRAELLAGLPRAKSALFMPAAQCLCIEQAFTE